MREIHSAVHDFIMRLDFAKQNFHVIKTTLFGLYVTYLPVQTPQFCHKVFPWLEHQVGHVDQKSGRLTGIHLIHGQGFQPGLGGTKEKTGASEEWLN